MQTVRHQVWPQVCNAFAHAKPQQGLLRQPEEHAVQGDTNEQALE